MISFSNGDSYTDLSKSVSENVELKSVVLCDDPVVTTFGESLSAYCESKAYLCDRDTGKNSNDDTLIQSFVQKSDSSVDYCGKKIYIDFESFSLDNNLELKTSFDRLFDKDDLKLLKKNERLNELLGHELHEGQMFRLVEKLIPVGSKIHVVGEVKRNNGKLVISKSESDSEISFLRFERHDKEIIKQKRKRYQGVLLGSLCVIAGVLVIMFLK